MSLFRSASLSSAKYHLPFSGRWFVVQGGDSVNVNHHMRVRSQFYGMDFMKVSVADGRSLTAKNPPSIEDWFSWEAEVLSPVDGEVVDVASKLPDNPLGERDSKNILGNFVEIKTSLSRYVFLAHLKKDSVTVEVGDMVKVGQVLGLCGNSGNSAAPHIHMHVQDAPVLGAGIGQNTIFSSVDIELSGKSFENVDWPMISGLWVSRNNR